MLTHSDIIGAKAIAQLGWVSAEVLIEELRALDGGGGDADLVQRLTIDGRLTPARAAEARAFVGRFHIVCHESVVLRCLEARGVERLSALLAQVEISGHERRLGVVAQRQGLISPQDAWELEQRAQQEVFRNGITLVERYRREEFAGVARPLIPGGALAAESFRVSRLFREHAFHLEVLQEIGRLRTQQISERDPQAAVRLPDEDDTTTLEDAPATLTRGLSSLPDIAQVGPYRVRRRLGQGGMGAVYLAVRDDDPLEAEVAVKVVSADAKGDDKLRFRREIDVSSRLEHPALVTVLDSGELADGTLYMVLPAYRSTSVKDLIKEGLVPPTMAFEIIDQLLVALGAVHKAGIVHRDVKPGNILLTQETKALRLIDFGISHFIAESEGQDHFQTGLGDFVGSVQYTAPENLTPDPLDARTDLYSVGVVAFELLTGRTPFGRMPRAQLLIAHLRQVPPLLSEVRPDDQWSPELEHLIRKLLAKVPSERPSSAADVLQVLRGGLAAESVRLLQGGDVGQISGSFKVVPQGRPTARGR